MSRKWPGDVRSPRRAGFGLARIWHNALRERHRPILGLGMPWFFIAMAGHGLYNFSVSVAEVAGWLEF